MRLRQPLLCFHCTATVPLTTNPFPPVLDKTGSSGWQLLCWTKSTNGLYAVYAIYVLHRKHCQPTAQIQYSTEYIRDYTDLPGVHAVYIHILSSKYRLVRRSRPRDSARLQKWRSKFSKASFSSVHVESREHREVNSCVNIWWWRMPLGWWAVECSRKGYHTS